MIRAVLFDMDGLIVDSEPIQFLAFRAFLREHGHELPESAMSDFVGYHEIENMRDLQEKHNLPGLIEDLVTRRRALYLELVKTEPLPVFPGFWELTAEARRRGLQQAVVSSSTREQVEVPLRRVFENHSDTTDPYQHFDAIVTGDDVRASKPDPEPYLLAAQRLGLDPRECVAFEDTPPGVASAAGAGVTVYAVPNEYTRHLEFPGARAVLATLHQARGHLGGAGGAPLESGAERRRKG